MVSKKGLEAPRPCEYVDLNHARLPIPPLRHETQIQRTAEPAASLSLANAEPAVKFWRERKSRKSRSLCGLPPLPHTVETQILRLRSGRQGWDTQSLYTSLASSVISVLLAKSFEIGHPALASAAALAKTSGVAPGTLAVVVSAMRVTAKPPSTLPSETAAWVSIFVGVSPAPPNSAPSAMEKQPACAAAINSSGVVPVAAPSKRVANEYFASFRTPVAVEIVPLPSFSEPVQTALALLAIFPPWGLLMLLSSASVDRPAVQKNSSAAKPLSSS